MESLYEADKFPALSWKRTYTDFLPSPAVNVHPLLVEYASHGSASKVPSLLTCIWVTLEVISEADNESVMEAECANTFPPSIVTEPVGANVSIV